jgi:hypothetical protein
MATANMHHRTHSVVCVMALTDKQRVEIAVPLNMLYYYVTAGGATGWQKAEGLLKAASLEPLFNLTYDRQIKLAKRIKRESDAARSAIPDSPPIVCFMVVLFLIRDLLASDCLVLHAGSNTDALLNSMIAAVARHQDYPSLSQGAERYTAKLLSHFQARGYYL